MGWIFRASQYFQFFPTTDDQLLLIVVVHMEGHALQWFQWALYNSHFHTWLEFVRVIERCFGSSEFDDSQGALAKLVQQTTVEAY